MIKVNYYETEEVTICPYCGSERDSDFSPGCCGESSAHFETAYLYQGEIYMADEIELYKPILETIQFETRRRLTKRFWRFKLRQVRDLTCKLYDGHDSLCRKLRHITGFRWSKLDCLILRQLHDFPLYYTSPAERLKQRQKGILYCVSQWVKDGAKHVDLVPRITDSERDAALKELNVS